MKPQNPSPRPAASKAASPVMLFGVDDAGKPKAAKFSDKHAEVATKAASHLQLRVLPITDPKVAALAARLPAGRIHANGRGFVPYVRRDLYAKLIEAAGPEPGSGQSATQPTSGSSGAGLPGNPGEPPRNLPKNWDEIGPGHCVIFQEDPEDGWYEAVVVDRRGDMLSLRWRDYPRARRFTMHRSASA